MWANLQRIVEKQGRTGEKKVWGDTLERGDTRGGVTPLVAAPGVTHPSDATAQFKFKSPSPLSSSPSPQKRTHFANTKTQKTQKNAPKIPTATFCRILYKRMTYDLRYLAHILCYVKVKFHHRRSQGVHWVHVHPPGRRKKIGAKFIGNSCNCTPRQSMHSRQSKSLFLGNCGDLDGGSG